MTARIRIARAIARLNVGGPARHVVWLTAALNDDRFESTLIAGSVPRGEEDMNSFATECGVRPLVVEEMSRAISPRDVVVVWKLFRIFRRLRPDIIHTHTAKAGAAGRIAGLLYRWLSRRRVRLVHTFHGHVLHSYYGPAVSWMFLAIERMLARFTDAIVVISPGQLEEIHGLYRIGRRDQFVVIPLGTDLAPKTGSGDLRIELDIGPAEFVAGIVGRLTEIKDHRAFLEGIAAWRETNPDTPATFLVIGGGHLRSSLEAYVRDLGLEGIVRFLGNRDDPEVFYPALDLLILTSRNEGTPLTVIEAMAFGIPPLATAVGGVPDLLGANVRDAGEGIAIRERGITFPPGHPRAFARAFSLLRNDPELLHELGERGRMHVQARHTVARLVRDIRDLYERLIRV